VVSHENPTDPVQIRGWLGLANVNDLDDRLVMVSDCEAAAVFQVTSTQAASTSGPDDIALVHASQDLRKQYPSAGTVADAQLVHNWAFFVAPTAFAPPAPAVPELALWRWDGVNPAQEMVEGVERLEVVFGIDANADQEVDQYVDATAAPTNPSDAERFWREVISVRMVVWVRSGPGVIPTNSPQRLDVDINLDGDTSDAGESVSFTDGRLRQVFTATVALRNRLS
jgi:type IV pilus assembly protein PilW